MREHWTFTWAELDKEPDYEFAEQRLQVERPAMGTRDVPLTCPRCGKGLTLQAKSRAYVWRKRWPWIAGTLALYAVLALLVVGIGVREAVKPLGNKWVNNDLVFPLILIGLFVPLAFALGGPLEIAKDPGKHKLERVRPFS